MDFINFNLSGEIIKIPRTELEMMLTENWYLPNLINSIGDEPGDTENEAYILYEDPLVFKDLIDSLRYQTLIITDENKLVYYIKLCEKWCVPEWLLEKLKSKLNRKEIMEEFIKNIFKVKKCINCHSTFVDTENNKDSCHFHPGKLNLGLTYECCALKMANGGPNIYCRKGYHISNRKLDLEILNKFMEISKLE